MTLNSSEDLWVKANSWTDRWTLVKQGVGSGGQGVGHRATRNGQDAFIKVISGVSRERRARFLNEAEAYAQLAIDHIPRLIESNARHFLDKSVELYIATEFVEGETLRLWRSRHQKLTLEQAISITLLLLDTVEQTHQAGVIHRDIKPENIIMPLEEEGSPVLVDFGIAYNQNDRKDKSLTQVNDQLGNRFLTLPELIGASKDKRSAVSDVTALAGILFYLLTRRNPVQLKDNFLRMPHQRDDIRPYLINFEHSGIQGFFDKAFAHASSERYQCAKDMRAALHHVLARASRTEPLTPRERIRELIGNHSDKTHREKLEKIREALRWAMNAYSSKVKEITDGALTASQTLIRENADPGYIRIRWDRFGDHRICTYLWVQLVGDELVWYTTSGEVFRLKATKDLPSPLPPSFFEKAIEIDTLRILELDPIDLTEEFSAHQSLREYLTNSLGDAVGLSKALNRPVFAVVYDDSRPASQRDFLLECVFAEKIVVEIISTTFVLLIIKRSQAPGLPQVFITGDYCAVIEGGVWTRIKHLAANSTAAVDYFVELKKTFSQ
ncbi:protein kinase domain-containing protein [Pseudomonas aeruginosa]|uniref:serine/threonine protein kinase n=1 Tax=Pseudomonas aeruginosa TaxID=287 RepID=UPI001F4B06DF|nr:protein kinase [Pseudomonas aeruginosa]